jgi:hypothetical protein
MEEFGTAQCSAGKDALGYRSQRQLQQACHLPGCHLSLLMKPAAWYRQVI